MDAAQAEMRDVPHLVSGPGLLLAPALHLGMADMAANEGVLVFPLRLVIVPCCPHIGA